MIEIFLFILDISCVKNYYKYYYKEENEYFVLNLRLSPFVKMYEYIFIYT